MWRHRKEEVCGRQIHRKTWQMMSERPLRKHGSQNFSLVCCFISILNTFCQNAAESSSSYGLSITPKQKHNVASSMTPSSCVNRNRQSNRNRVLSKFRWFRSLPGFFFFIPNYQKKEKKCTIVMQFKSVWPSIYLSFQQNPNTSFTMNYVSPNKLENRNT